MIPYNSNMKNAPTTTTAIGANSSIEFSGIYAFGITPASQ